MTGRLADNIKAAKESPTAVAARLAKLDPAEAEVLAADEAKRLGIRLSVLRRSIDAARKRQSGAGKAPSRSKRRAQPDDQRPVIKLAGGQLHDEAAEAELHLARHPNVFQRGGQLVRIGRMAEPSNGSVRRSQGELVILPHNLATMRAALTEAVLFKKYDRRTEEYLPVNCPSDLADVVLSSSGQWENTRPLHGVVESPTVRRDGTVLDKPGYDARTGLYFDPGGVEFPPVPDRPSRDQALAALEVLKEPFRDIPFVAEADLAVALSCVITALTRRSMRAAPAFAFSAPKPGSGKTLTATLASYISTGRPPALMSQAEDAESERKRLFSILLEGAVVACIDNIERPLASDSLCSILTEPLFRDRQLGASRTVTAPTCITWALTGNNLSVVGDLSTRTLISRIDPECERPEEREFGVNLHDDVPKQRPRFVVAALTAVRGYIAAGSPRLGVPSYGRFEDWQELCRFPLIWLGLSDPCSTRLTAEARDPIRERLSGLSEAWAALFNSEEVTLAVAISEATKDQPLIQAPRDEARARLHAAMLDIAADGRRVNARKLGWFLTKTEKRIEAGRRFVRGEDRRAGALWRVEKVSHSAGLSSFAGSPITPTEKWQNDSYKERQESHSQNTTNPQAIDDPAEDPAEVTLRGEAEL